MAGSGGGLTFDNDGIRPDPGFRIKFILPVDHNTARQLEKRRHFIAKLRAVDIIHRNSHPIGPRKRIRIDDLILRPLDMGIIDFQLNVLCQRGRLQRVSA